MTVHTYVLCMPIIFYNILKYIPIILNLKITTVCKMREKVLKTTGYYFIAFKLSIIACETCSFHHIFCSHKCGNKKEKKTAD